MMDDVMPSYNVNEQPSIAELRQKLAQIEKEVAEKEKQDLTIKDKTKEVCSAIVEYCICFFICFWATRYICDVVRKVWQLRGIGLSMESILRDIIDNPGKWFPNLY